MTSPTFAPLFTPEPGTWGLRGDPWVWRRMLEELAEVPLPSSADESVTRVRQSFHTVVGLDLDAPDSPEMVFREEFAYGGMSGGVVHLGAWRESLMPMLEQRVREHFAAQ